MTDAHARALPAAVFFDCDGVLIDTEVTSARVLSERLAREGVDRTPDQIREVIKGTSLEFVAEEAARLLGRPLPDGWMRAFIDERFVEYRRGVDQIPGAATAIEAVRAAGIPIAVTSQGSREKMRVTLPASGMDVVLGDTPIFSGDDVERGKPHPDLYLHAAATLGVDPASVVVVEDSPTGATGAHAAGARVLGLSGDSDPDAMRAAGAEVFYDMAELPWRIGIPGADPPN